jgi:hypothetical protein
MRGSWQRSPTRTANRWAITELRSGAASFVSASGTVPSTGIIAVCRLHQGTEVEIAAWTSRTHVARVRERLDKKITAVRMTMASRMVARVAPIDEPASLVAAGTVRDSASGTPVASARIAFLGTPFEAASDDSGRFVLGGLKRGQHPVEISTPWLDSIGAVRRTTVTIDERAPIVLFLPTVGVTLRSSCGVTVEEGEGAIVGQVHSLATGPVPGTTRVIAEWDSIVEPAVRARTAGVIGAGGSYRLCGVPTGRTIAVHVALDTLARESATVYIDPVRRFARLDFTVKPPVMPPMW